MQKQQTTTTTRRTRRGGAQKNQKNGVSTTTTTKTTKNSRRSRKRSSVMASPNYQLGRMNISPCALNYARVLADPFNPANPSDVCLPDTNSQPSFKFQARSRGMITLNSSGFGFVAVSPVAMANNTIPSVCFSSNGTVASSNSVPASADAAWTTSVGSNSPFGDTSASAVNSPLTRVVVTGVRVRYTGTELNRGGSLVVYKASTTGPSNALNSGMGGQSMSTILSNYAAVSSPIDRRWHSVVWTPLDQDGGDYTHVPTNYAVNNSTMGVKTLGIAITGMAGNTFEFEVASYHEAIPYNNTSSGVNYAPPSLSASDTDVVGYSFIKDVLAKASDNVSGQGLWNMFQTAAKLYYKTEMPLTSAFSGTLKALL